MQINLDETSSYALIGSGEPVGWCQLQKMLMMACFPSIAVFLGVDGDAGAEDMES